MSVNSEKRSILISPINISLFRFLGKYIDVLFKHKSLILETISDITLLEQGLDAMDHGTEHVSEVKK